MTTWAILCLVFFNYDPTEAFNLYDYSQLSTFWFIFTLEPLDKVLSAIVLVVSVVYFRRKINFLQFKLVRTREKLMLVHTVTFLLCIVVYLGSLVFNSIYHKNLQSLSDDLYTDMIIAEKYREPVEIFTDVSPISVCR